MSSFADLMKGKNNNFQLTKPNGSLIKGKIIGNIEIRGKEYNLIDCGLKYEGIVLKHEVEHLDKSSEIDFVIINEFENYYNLSHEKAKKESALKVFKDLFHKKEKVKGKIVAKTNDGYKILLNNEFTGLLNSKDDLNIGDEVECFISKVNNNGVYLSNQEPVLYSSNRDGDIVNGTVISFNDYFVFVEIEGSDLEGVIHFHDLSWEHINFPGEKVNQGEKLKLKVLKIQNKCMYLSLKDTQPDPWLKIKDLVKVGDTSKGTIQGINDYELVISLDKGVVGYVHISEISWGFKRGSTLNEEFKVGDAIDVKIIEIDTYRKRLKLSMKQLQENPFISFCKKHKVGDSIEGVVLNDSTSYGTFLFVQLIPGVDGILHQSEMDWSIEDSIAKFNNLEKGNKIEVKITGINEEKSRVSVSVKRLKPDLFESAFKDLQVGKYYDVEIVKISYDGLDVRLVDYPQCTAFIKKSEISSDKNVRTNNFSVGDKLQAKLTSLIESKRLLIMSIRAKQMDDNKMSIRENNQISQTSFSDFIDK